MKIMICGKEKTYPEGISYEEIAAGFQEEYHHRIVLVIANGKIKELSKKAADGEELQFLTTEDKIGHDTYVRSAFMLLVKAAADVAGTPGKGQLKIEFSLGKGYYCSPKEECVITPDFIEKVKSRMKELVEAALPIEKTPYQTEAAMKLFGAQGMEDKVNLFKYRRSSWVNVYTLDGYHDYYYGYMLPSTAYIRYFDLCPYEKGMMLVLPDRKEPEKIPVMEKREKLFSTLMDSTCWGEKIGIDTVGDLNDRICEGDITELILVQEALQERRIAEIASDIAARGHVKFVMIAGPSSSGKTTFSHRLSIQLRTHGLNPHPIAMDDYFVNRENTPRDENGDYNFECLEAIDVKQFNQDMIDLLSGKTVEMPAYNFKTGKREYKGNFKTLGKDDILVIEGIHGLNDKLSHSLPVDSKYKIYISALTCLNVDGHNRIATTDSRLLRRMVRDARTRGVSARETFERWTSVRRGEEENIFPYQESADAMFNSALIYELAVLKQFAEPLLYSIKKGDSEYYEAKRLLKFLDYFLGVSSENLPNNSIVREFVGGSCFRV